MLVATDELLEEIENTPYTEQAKWLFLIQSDQFKGFWQVEGLDPIFFFDFEELIGAYRLVSPITINEFLAYAEELGYISVFMDDPTDIIEAYEYLKTIPDISLNSTLENTVNGFLPWQVTGYNKLIKNDKLVAGLVIWATGSGKAAFMAAAIKYHMQQERHIDTILICVKSHNKIDTQRKLKSLGDIDSVIIDGSKTRRQKMYEQQIEIDTRIIIINYEKIREDHEDMYPLIQNQNCLIFFDEAPTRLANRDTKLYKATRKLLYEAFPNRPRADWMRSWALTATPVENSPDDVFSVVNIMAPGTLGTVRDFHSEYVATTNMWSGKPDQWKNLDSLEAKLQFMTHRVSKDDPDVAKMFPTSLRPPKQIDWNPKHKHLYDQLTGKIKDIYEKLEDANILAMIQIMQMMCDAPSMIVESANNKAKFYASLEETSDELDYKGPQGSDIALTLVESLGLDAFTNVGHTKLETWKEIITEIHPTEKIVTHSTWSEYIFPVWEEYLTKHDISYVVYRGNSKEKQQALDAFRDDPSIRCFLSGDAGADSIDIVEASVGINYNIPWKKTTLYQREGRRDRVNSLYDNIYTYTLMMPFSVDERKMEICNKKWGYHTQLFDGKANDESVSASMTKEELIYLLLG